MSQLARYIQFFIGFMDSHPLPKILMVDDEPDLPGVVESMLTDIATVESYMTGEDAVGAMQGRVFPAAIIDLQIRTDGNVACMQGMEVMRTLQNTCPFTQIIILTAHASLETAMLAVNHGAFRYLVKPFFRDTLRAAVSRALETYDAALQAQAKLSLTRIQFESMGLTSRLADVAEGVLEGQSNVEIATNLKIADRTVEKHVERLLAHFEINSRFLLESAMIRRLRTKSR